MAERAYFDWNATAKLRPEAKAAMAAALERQGNPSSIHAEGRAMRRLVEDARAQVARLVGAEQKQVTFTSGGTEANVLALTPALECGGHKTPRDALFVSAIEHPAVHSGGRFDAIQELPVTANGVVDLAQIEAIISKAARPLVSVMLANNETGVIQPIAQVAEIVHRCNGILHVDAVQAAGKIEVNFAALGADLMSIAAHKLGGPIGVGALIVRSDIHIAEPMMRGGGQERRLRPGTENVAGIAGFGAAAEAALADLKPSHARMTALRDRIESELRRTAEDLVIFGEHAERLPNTVLFALPGAKAETLTISFDLNGIAVSAGAACSSGKVQASHVLKAMGVDPEIAKGAIRVSLGWSTTDAEAEQLISAWNKAVSSLPKGQRGIAA